LLFPEKWQYYDVDLNKVKENMKKGTDFAENLKLDEFKEHEEFMSLMHNYFER
jgi:hypothetical protein